MAAFESNVEISEQNSIPDGSFLKIQFPKPTELSVEVIRDAETLKLNRLAWESLVFKVPATVFQSFDWLTLWWQHFGRGRGRSLHVLLLRANRLLVGIIPLFVEVKTVAGFPVNKRLRFLGCDVMTHGSHGIYDRYSPSDMLDAIVDPAYGKEVALTFREYLKNNAILWDDIELCNLLDESILMKELLPLLDEEGIRYKRKQIDICPRLNPISSLKEYFTTLKPGVRRKLSQSLKTSNNQGNATVESINSYQEIESSFRDLMDLHQSRWNDMGYPGVFSDQRFVRFQEDVAHSFYLRGWLWFKTVRINGTRVAARMGFNFKNTLYDYLAGFNNQPQWSKQRPGLALLVLMIEEMTHGGAAGVEFLRGAEPYKFELTGTWSHISRIHIKNPQSISRLRTMLFGLEQLYERFLYRIFIELSSLRAHTRRSWNPVMVLKYVYFRTKCIVEAVHRRSTEPSIAS